MALTVEDGTGLAGADSFVSLAACDAYCLAHGLTDWSGVASSPSTLKDAALRRATSYLSNSFTWKGYKLNGRSQALAWPRTDVTDEEGLDVASDEVPSEIIAACCEIASRELAAPGFTSPDVVLTDRIRREKVGPLEVEYASAPVSAEAARPVLMLVQDMLAGLISGSANALVGTAARG